MLKLLKLSTGSADARSVERTQRLLRNFRCDYFGCRRTFNRKMSNCQHCFVLMKRVAIVRHN